jgi:hypothetical protein
VIKGILRFTVDEKRISSCNSPSFKAL